MGDNWGIALVSTSGSEILVTDTFDGKPVGNPRPAVYDPLLDCELDGMCIILENKKNSLS